MPVRNTSPIVIGIDLGTTKITCVAIDASSGNTLAINATQNSANITEFRARSGGRSEWDAKLISRMALNCLSSVAIGLGERVADVTGIGITGQQHGTVIVDATTGEPVSPLINWQDRRALEQMPDGTTTWLEAVRSAIGPEAWKRTGCWLHPGFMAVTLFEMKRRRTLPDNARALFIMDYFGSILTGQPPVTEPSCAGSSGVFDIRSRQWNDDAIKALDLPRSLFPEIREANESIGCLTSEWTGTTGLPAGTPVFAPIGDHQASFLGSIANRKNSVLVNVGTGAQVAVYTDKPDFELPIELRPFPCGGNLLSNVGLAGGWSYQILEEFFLDVGRQLYSTDPTEEMYHLMSDAAATVEAGADGLRCEPTFSGTRLDPTVRGSITGLSARNFTSGHLARAVLEGMGRSLYGGFEAIGRIAKCSPTTLVAAGNGLRKNRLLAEIVSKEFGLPVTLTQHQEEAAFGAAIVASVGTGIFSSIDEAASTLVHTALAD